MPDILDIVVIFHGIDELLHLHTLFLAQGLIVLGNHLNLGRDEGVFAQVRNNIVEIIGQGVDGENIAIGLEVVRACISITAKSISTGGILLQPDAGIMYSTISCSVTRL